jgi:hypothetical protein
MKKIIPGIFAAGLLLLLFAFNAAEAKTITMDEEFDDWDDVSTLVSESITGYPYSGTIYHFDNSSDSWVVGSDENACMYTANRALDLGELKLTNDDNYLYILWKRGSDFLNYYWRRGDATEEYLLSNEAAPSINGNPCAGEIVTAPADFDHDLILSVDKNKDGSYDYYLVISISFEAGAYNGYDTAGRVYKDNGNGIYDRAEETLVSTFGTHEYEVSPSAAAVNSAVLQEVKMDIAEIFNKLDLSWGDSVNVRYESHSDAVDYTDAEEYTFEDTNNIIDDDTDAERAKIDSWKAYRYENSNGVSCPNKLVLEIKGKHFDKDAEVKIGDKKAYSVEKKSSKKIVAKFCLDDLLKIKTGLARRIHVINPDAQERTAAKKIHLNAVGYELSESDFGADSIEGTKSIQQALSQLGFLDSRYITGFFGPITTEAVKEFQKQNGISQTGYVGPLTKASLEENLE